MFCGSYHLRIFCPVSSLVSFPRHVPVSFFKMALTSIQKGTTLSVFVFHFYCFVFVCFDSCLKTDIRERTPDFTQILQFYNILDHHFMKKCIIIIAYFILHLEVEAQLVMSAFGYFVPCSKLLP